MKLTKEQLEKFAAEINKDWIGGYVAKVVNYNLESDDYERSSALIITRNLESIFCCKLFQNGTIESDDADALAQLEYMLNR